MKMNNTRCLTKIFFVARNAETVTEKTSQLTGAGGTKKPTRRCGAKSGEVIQDRCATYGRSCHIGSGCLLHYNREPGEKLTRFHF